MLDHYCTTTTCPTDYYYYYYYYLVGLVGVEGDKEGDPLEPLASLLDLTAGYNVGHLQASGSSSRKAIRSINVKTGCGNTRGSTYCCCCWWWWWWW